LSQTTDRQTDNRQTDIFELTPIHMGNLVCFFAFRRERTNGAKFIPAVHASPFPSVSDQSAVQSPVLVSTETMDFCQNVSYYYFFVVNFRLGLVS
jgi:hypothetical protein